MVFEEIDAGITNSQRLYWRWTPLPFICSNHGYGTIPILRVLMIDPYEVIPRLTETIFLPLGPRTGLDCGVI
jgi:hypothetical protein